MNEIAGYNFTERLRKILALSGDEAKRLHHAYVGTEHLLLGIIVEGGGVAATVIENLNVNLEDLKHAVEKLAHEGPEAQGTGPDIPFTYRAKKALERAMTESRELGMSYVGSEHLLLGLLWEENGQAGQALTSFGINLETAREAVKHQLGI